MMSIAAQLNALRIKVAELESRFEEEQENRNWPAEGSMIFRINFDTGEVVDDCWEGRDVDFVNQDLGNIFKTRVEALNELECRRVVTALRNTSGRVDSFKATHRIIGLCVLLPQDIVTPSEDVWEFGLTWLTTDHVRDAIEKVGRRRIIDAATHISRM